MQKEAERLEISAQQIICTGDIVAYCAEPEQTTNLLIDWNIPTVMGNCEESLGENAADCGCGFEAGTACATLSIDWYNFSIQRISSESATWMRDLPRAIEFNLANKSFRVVHGSVSKINKFIFQSTAIEELQAEINLAATDVVIGGHSGLPFARKVENKHWLNAGVIGMPANDGTQDGWYMLLTPTEKDQVEVSWQRLKYDATHTQQSMQRSGLANGYADAITSGLWPSMDVLPEQERMAQGKKIKLNAINI